MKRERHPNWYKDVPVMKILLLGSFPPHKAKWDYPFYYPNSQNRFWKILSGISNIELKYLKTKNESEDIKSKAVEERYSIMKHLNIGVQNLGLEITRKGLSARDTDIVINEFQNILSIINNHKELERILLPGFSAANSTYWGFIKYLKNNSIEVNPQKPYPKMQFELLIEDRKIQCIVLNSTSTASRIKYTEILNQFKNYI